MLIFDKKLCAFRVLDIKNSIHTYFRCIIPIIIADDANFASKRRPEFQVSYIFLRFHARCMLGGLFYYSERVKVCHQADIKIPDTITEKVRFS